MWPIVRDALADASPPIRNQIRWVIVLWCVLVFGQVWDSRNAQGVSGVAEFLSAVLGATGVALLGAAHTLQRTMDEAANRPRRREDAAALQQVLLVLPALGFASGAALGAAAALMVLRALLGTEMFLVVAAFTMYCGMLVFAGHTVMSSARTLFRHATHQAAIAADARSQVAAAQLGALQARMNPHFLFNALNTVASLVRSDPPAAERVVENLSDVLRQTLRRSAGSIGTVEDELEYLRGYLTLEQERWGSRLRVEWDVDDSARTRALPPLVLQPLVENALAHGIGSRLTGGTIWITVRAGDSLMIRVTDDGPGFPARWTEGTGLGNLRERLETIYSGRATIDVANEGEGAQVTITLPSASDATRAVTVLVGGLQAVDSGVLRAGPGAQAFVVLGIASPALALTLTNKWAVWVTALVVGDALFVWARVVSPVPLKTLHIGLMVPARYIFFVSRLESNVAGETTTVRRG